MDTETDAGVRPAAEAGAEQQRPSTPPAQLTPPQPAEEPAVVSPSSILKRRGGAGAGDRADAASPRACKPRVTFDLEANTNHILEPLSPSPEAAPVKASWPSPSRTSPSKRAVFLSSGGGNSASGGGGVSGGGLFIRG